MAKVLLPGVFIGKEQLPAGFEVLIFFLMAGDFLLKELACQWVSSRIQQVKLHGKVVSGWHRLAQWFMHPGGQQLLSAFCNLIELFFELFADEFCAGPDQAVIFHMAQFGIYLAMVGIPKIA